MTFTHVLNKAVKGNQDFLVKRLGDLDPTQRWSVKVEPFKSTRSIAQNSRYWAFLTAYGNYLGYTRDEMHDLCKYKFLSDHVEINGEKMVKLKSTPKTNTKEFSEYCDMCEMWAAQLGFYWS